MQIIDLTGVVELNIKKRTEFNSKEDLGLELGKQPILVGRNSHFTLFKQILENKLIDTKQIYCFTGAEGIGKTALCNKFLELSEQYEHIIAVKLNLRNKMFLEPANFLFELRKMLAKKEPSFNFVLFDSAFAYFWIRAFSSEDLKKKAMEFEEGNILLEIAKMLSKSTVLLAPKIILEIATRYLPTIVTSKAKEFLEKLASIEKIREIKEILGQALSIDLKINLRHSKEKKVLIFVDALENILDERQDQSNENEYQLDSWLRSIIKSTLEECDKKVYWFLFENDTKKLFNDQDLKEFLNFEKVEPLSEEESINLLKKSGITNERIQKRIIETTKGLPFNLNIAVAIYNNLKKLHRPESTLNDLPSEEKGLVYSYIDTLKEEKAQLIKALAVPRVWNKEIIEYLINELNLAVNVEDSLKLIDQSFVEKLGEEHCAFHEKFRAYVYQYYFETESDEIKTIHQKLIEYYSKFTGFKAPSEITPEKLAYLSEWLYHSLQINFQETLVSFLDIAELLYDVEYYEYTYAELKSILNEYELPPAERNRYLTYLGYAAFYLGYPDEAKDLYMKAYDSFLEHNLKGKGLVDVAIELGNLHKALKEYEKALYYYDVSLDLLEERDKPSGQTFVMNKIGGLFAEQGDHDFSQFIKYLEHAH